MNKKLTGIITADPALGAGGLLPSGPRGKVWTPAVDEESVLSWTLDDGQTQPEPVNIKGPPGDVDYGYLKTITTFTHEQGAGSTVWTIEHGLGFYPSVSVVDYGNNLVYGDIKYIDKNNLTVSFTVKVSGYAYLS